MSVAIAFSTACARALKPVLLAACGRYGVRRASSCDWGGLVLGAPLSREDWSRVRAPRLRLADARHISVAVAHLLLERGADVDRPMPNEMSTLDLLACNDRPKLKKLVRKFLAMRVRRCVLGPASEHSRRQMARDLAPEIASFLV